MLTIVIPKYLGIYDKRLEENKSQIHMVGEKVTVADFALGAFLYNFFLNEGSEHNMILQPLMEGFEYVTKFGEHYGKELAEHLKNRPKPRQY